MTTERKINGTFVKAVGGYVRRIDENTSIFVPEFSAAGRNPSGFCCKQTASKTASKLAFKILKMIIII